MRTVIAIAIIAFATQAMAAPSDRYADGSGYAGKAIERLLQSEIDDEPEGVEDAPQEVLEECALGQRHAGV